MKKLLDVFKKKVSTGRVIVPDRKDLDRKAVEGAEKAVREYRRVFERLAEYDRK